MKNMADLSAQHTCNSGRLVAANRWTAVEPMQSLRGIPGAYPGPLGVCTGGLFQNTPHRGAGGPFGVFSDDEAEQRSPAQVKELAGRQLGQTVDSLTG
jgi:hypothetical protein